MAKVRQTGTATELTVMEIIGELGIGYRTNAKDLPGSPDLVNDRYHWAILVHGCFWHAHEGCKLWTIPKSNRDFWLRKFKDNRARDRRKRTELARKGFSVLVIWQCELDDPEAIKKKLAKFCFHSSVVRSDISSVFDAS
jgi:DNA mismatch endonuclease (patch repair protein)